MNKKDIEYLVDIFYNRPKGPAGYGSRYVKEPYMDFAKSYATQAKGDPTTSAVLSGLGYGGLGAILGGAIGKLLPDERAGLGAALGGLLGAGAGAYSGYRGQESENSRANALKRMGVDSPMEYATLQAAPELAEMMVEKGYAGGYKRGPKKKDPMLEEAEASEYEEKQGSAKLTWLWNLLKSPTVQKNTAGAVLGGAYGRYATPNLMGYEGNEPATNLSTLMGMLAGVSVANGKMQQAAGSLATGEIIPMGMEYFDNRNKLEEKNREEFFSGFSKVYDHLKRFDKIRIKKDNGKHEIGINNLAGPNIIC